MFEISIIDQLSVLCVKRKLVKTVIDGFAVKNAKKNGNYLMEIYVLIIMLELKEVTLAAKSIFSL